MKVEHAMPPKLNDSTVGSLYTKSTLSYKSVYVFHP